MKRLSSPSIVLGLSDVGLGGGSVCVHAFKYIPTQMHVYTHTNTHKCEHVHIYTCLYVYTCSRIRPPPPRLCEFKDSMNQLRQLSME